MGFGCKCVIESWTVKINSFLFKRGFCSLLNCSLHAYTPHLIRQASTLPLFYPLLQKEALSGWTVSVQAKTRTKENEGLDSVWLNKQKQKGEYKNFDAPFHPHSVSISFSSLFFLSLSVLWELGVSCNLSIGFSLAYPITCSPSYLFLFLLNLS